MDILVLALTNNMAASASPLEDLSKLKRLYIGANPLNDNSILNNLVGLHHAWLGSRNSARVLEMKRSNNDQIVTTDGVCSAGYVYRPYKTCRHETHGIESYKKLRSKVCGIEKSTPTYKSCRTAANGVEPRVIGRHEKVFSLVSKNKGTHVATQQKVKKMCTDWAATHGSEVTVAKPTQAIKSSRMGVGDLRVYFTKCIVQVYYYKQARNQYCGVESLAHTYKICAHASHGVELYKNKLSQVCGLEEFTKNSDNNMNKAGLSKYFGQAQRCRSCDDELIQTSRQATGKAECMIYSSKADPNDKLTLAIERLIENEISLLLEEKAVEIEKL